MFISKSVKSLAKDMIENYKKWSISDDMLYKHNIDGSEFYIRSWSNVFMSHVITIPYIKLSRREEKYLAKAFNKCVILKITGGKNEKEKD
jgi:hypothetical protein